MKSTYIKYVVLCVLFLLITESSKSILHLEKMSYNTLAENLTDEELQNYVDLKDKWQWISYVFVPLILLIKTTLTASILYIGTFFFSKIEITFKALWNIVIKAEFFFY